VSALGRLFGVLPRQRSAATRTVAWAIALTGPPAIAALAEPVRASLTLSGYLFCALLIVVVVALIGGVLPALAAVVTGFLAGAYVFAPPYDSLRVYLHVDNAPLVAFVVVGAVIAALIDELTRLVGEQAAVRRVEAALRRVATLVARAAPADDLFAAATEEVGELLAVDLAAMARVEPDGSATIVASWSGTGQGLSVGTRAPLDDELGGSVLRDAGIRSAVAAPIVVEARRWGVMIAGSMLERPLPQDTEARLADFTELLATAIANAESRDALAASRLRIVATADETRRRIERDLHDGAQQRLVSLALGLRATMGSVPGAESGLRAELAAVADGLTGVQEELREIARGIHPAMLAEGGIGPALRTLARRSAVPVELDLRADKRMPAPVEAAIYYVVSEVLTNTAKHSGASRVSVGVAAEGGVVRVWVRDDGAGGADPGRGSGLVGLRDRVEALGGRLEIDSPPGAGTAIFAEIPVER
jgi:signal transduction histidine kinase